jgi:ribosome-associated toxin RatA of RatAB toxin-antitoxin module
MTLVSTSVTIDSSPERIFALARATDRWPQLLPHYRFVHVLEQAGNRRVVEMAARRGIIPVRWTAEQIDDETAPAIRFRHLSGWTKGMEVEWRFEPAGERTRVTILHDLHFRFPIAQRFVERWIVGQFFIHGIASRTLGRMKRLAEGLRHA